MDSKELVERALFARSRSYAKYSNFAVGAALVTAQNEVFLGCNVENVSLGLTMCAERVAVASAIAAGTRDFAAIAIVADSIDPILPCGACRQVMAEFNSEMKVISATISGRVEEFLLEYLLPKSEQGILR